jgi:serine/threonine-protein kinase
MPEQRYKVLKKLDSGGMAEVFLGSAESLQGFKKRVAIKRVLPHLAENRKFMAMFLDEARLSLHLNHANVVQTFDIGVADNTYFIVMEYVDGSNLKTVLEVAESHGSPIPVANSVFILIEVLKALSYAHELIDDQGRSLGIVHRDVSPPNVLISKRGEVKLVDFGLAKAVGQLEHTDPGIVKGKFSYLSPEAAAGLEVDSRADIFAAGILLYEMLTGRRLFLGETDLQTLELVRRAEVPSVLPLNPQVPPPLEQVVQRALSRDIHGRYQSAREMGDALAHVLFAHNMKVTNFDIGSLVSEVLAEDRAVRPEPSIIDRLIQEELLRFTSLDELEEKLGRGYDPLELRDAGAQPLDGGAFEDPRQWANELLEDRSEAPSPSAGSDWQGSPPPQVSTQQRPRHQKGLQPGNLARALEGDTTRQPMAVPSPPPKSSAGLKVLLVILIFALLGVSGAIAYLLLQ